MVLSHAIFFQMLNVKVPGGGRTDWYRDVQHFIVFDHLFYWHNHYVNNIVRDDDLTYISSSYYYLRVQDTDGSLLFRKLKRIKMSFPCLFSLSISRVNNKNKKNPFACLERIFLETFLHFSLIVQSPVRFWSFKRPRGVLKWRVSKSRRLYYFWIGR